jgi:hypothetical protein
MTNFFSTYCCPQSTLPILPADVDCVPLPSLSQLAGVILLPLGAPLPEDWTDYYSWMQVLDNLDLSGLKGRYFIVTGEITEAQDIVQRLGRTKNLIVRKRYTATIYPQWFDNESYEFLRSIQKSKLSFRFWLATYGGRLLGGAKGIRPEFVTAKMIYAGDSASFEQAKFILEWYADVEPDRTNLPQLLIA